MKNHPVNNDYVQNLQEGLLNEAKQTVYQSKDKPENKSYLTKDVKLDKFPIEKKKVNEVRGNEQATKDRIAKAAGRMTRASQLNRSESRDGKSFLRKPENVVQPPRADGRPAKTPEEIASQRGRIHRKLNARDEYNSTEHTEHQKSFDAGRKEAEKKEEEEVQAESRREGLVGGEKIKDKNSYSGMSDGKGNPVRIGGNSSGSVLPGATNSNLDSAKKRIKKELKLKLENAEVGYPERGIEGGTAEAKAYANRVAMRGKYKKKVEDQTRKRLAAAPALASIQQESYDIVDSRLSSEDAKIDQNVKTRGVKKKKGEKPVPMTNSDGEKIGEQDSGTRPRSQDLNTRGRLNKKREGEGMIAKGKRFIKKKFS